MVSLGLASLRRSKRERSDFFNPRMADEAPCAGVFRLLTLSGAGNAAFTASKFSGESAERYKCSPSREAARESIRERELAEGRTRTAIGMLFSTVISSDSEEPV